MIKSKSNVVELIQEVKSFRYYKEDSTEVDVSLKEGDCISIRYDTPKCIFINLYDYDKAISMLYKDRKYINKYLVNCYN